MTDRALGPHVTFLGGERQGRYPQGNSLLVAGTQARVIVDPSLSVVARAERPAVDAVLNSHCHEDHVAGNHCYPAVPWRVHEADALGLLSLDGLMAIYGMSPAVAAGWRRALVEQFHYTARPDVGTFTDGDVFDLGGCTIRVVHAPGHTRGHCCFLIEPDGVLYLGDIDLSSFGPYYGDAWSDLAAFERTLATVRAIDARWYATFHHAGAIEGRTAFVERLDRFTAVIASREARLLEFLAEPRPLDEIVAHRFVYRPGDAVPYADDVERRSMGQHLGRLTARGTVQETASGVFVRTDRLPG